MKKIFVTAIITACAITALNGQLAVHNRYWLEEASTGEAVYLLGHGITNLISQTQVDIVAHNSHYAAWGANSLRLHLTQGALGEGAPWKQLPDGRYDLGAWNEVYWRRLETFMQDCLARGIYPFIQIWDEPMIEHGDRRWKLHPWRPSNNINNLRGLGDDPEGHGMPGFYDTGNEELMRLQRMFVRRVLDYTARYGIAVYSFCNEYDYGNRAPLEWQDYWIDFFRRYERENELVSAPLLFTNTAVRKYMDEGSDRFRVIDWYYLGGRFRMKSFGREGEDQAGVDPATIAGMIREARGLYPGKVLLNSRPTSSPDRGRKDYSNEDESRMIVWCSFMSASSVCGFRHLNTEQMDDPEPWLRTDPDCIECTDGLAVERVLRSVRRFIELSGLDLLELKPEAALDGDRPVLELAGPGTRVVFLPLGGRAGVEDLESYGSILRYDPRDPDAGLVKPASSETAPAALVAPGPETVYLLRKSAPAGETFRFREATRRCGILHEPNRSYHGAYLVDVDGDGYEDMFLTGHDGPNLLYMNRTAGKGYLWFEEEGSARGAAYGPHHRRIDGKTLWELHGAGFLDADLDGDADLYLPVTADCSRPDPGDRLLINNGGGYFTAAGQKWGVTGERFNRRGACVADFNRDGLDDIYVADNFHINCEGEDRLVPEPYRSVYMSSPGGGFDFTAAGIGMTYTHGATAVDIDGDGDCDLIESHPRGEGLTLHRNDGEGNFRPDRDSGLPVSGKYSGVCPGDIDNDGDQDLVLCAYNMDTGFVMRNDGGGRFSVFREVEGSESAVLADFDHDGDQDLYMAGAAFYENRDGALVERPELSRLRYSSLVGFPRGCAVADLDHDGDPDLVSVAQANLYVNDPYWLGYRVPYLRVFENRTGNDRWLGVKVLKQGGSPLAYGAKVSLHRAGGLDSGVKPLQVRELISNNGFVNQNSPVLHFGGVPERLDLRCTGPLGSVVERKNIETGRIIEISL